MQKTVLALGALAVFGFAQPTSAMMCGPGQQGAQAQQTQAQGGMCGPGQATADDPFKENQAQQGSGMCPCCRNMMAMMRGGMRGMGGGGSDMQHHNMPGMEMPKQQ